MTPDPPPDPKRPRGRPRLEEPLTQVSTRIPPRVYDRLIRMAKQQETTVADLLRKRIFRTL